jgi:hypothetical protein
MKCYAEGTKKGLIRIRDIEKRGECMLLLPSGFTDKVEFCQYSAEKNILFMGSRDGWLKAWKVPSEWRQGWIER